MGAANAYCCSTREASPGNNNLAALRDGSRLVLRSEAKVVHKVQVAPGHFRLRLAWKDPGTAPRLTTGEHLILYAPNRQGQVYRKWCGKADEEFGHSEIARRYTPVAGDPVAGWYDVVVQLVTPEMAPPDGGKFSHFASSLSSGSSLGVSGPHGLYRYIGAGRFERRCGSAAAEEVRATDVVLLAKGASINTVMNLAQMVAREKEDAPKLWIIAAAHNSEAVLHRSAVEGLAAQRPGRINVWYTLENGEAPEGWPYGAGNLSKALTQEHMPPPGRTVLVVSLGSQGVQKACEDGVRALGLEPVAQWRWNEELD